MKALNSSTRDFLLMELFKGAQEGMIITDERVRIRACNDAFCRISGYCEAELLGHNPSILSSGKQDKAFYMTMWQRIKRDGFWEGEVWNRKRDGSFYAELLSIRKVQVPDTGDICYLGMMSDITSMKEHHAALEKLAHYDSLTGLPNRNLLEDRFEQAVAKCDRMQEMMAVCFLDLDDFKPVNDRFGHNVGDQLLVDLAARIGDYIRHGDTVSRYGGDEFVILLTELSCRSDCDRLLEGLLKQISAPYYIEGTRINIGASIGYTLYPFDRGSLDALIEHADHTLYQVKNTGKSAISMYGQSLRVNTGVSSHFTQATVLAAIQAEQLRLFFQPQIDMSSGELIGFEALVRWQHPQQGLLSPIDFLPVINHCEVEICLGCWVIKAALQQLQNWHRAGLALHVSVNLSAYQLAAEGFLDSLKAICADFPELDLSYFQIEILESHALDEISTLKHVIEDCQQQLTISTALDDFGTGYSSLSHIRVLPIKTIKIDQSFVRNMLNDANDFKIVESVISLATSFDIEVIAEGVESVRHGEVLLCMGCKKAQGYAIAKPMAAGRVLSWAGNFRAPEVFLHTFRNNVSLRRAQLNLFVHFLEVEFESAGKRLAAGLYSNEVRWPVQSVNHSHCGFWLKKARATHFIEQDFQHRLKTCYAHFVSAIVNVMTLYKCGDQAAAEAAFQGVEQNYQRLCTLIAEKLQDPLSS